MLAAMSVAALMGLVNPSHAQESQCANIYHDEGPSADGDNGPVNAIMLANLLGHWPHYEIRGRPIEAYRSEDMAQCKATLYVSTRADSEAPNAFLTDFFKTDKNIAWLGFGTHQLDAAQFLRTFQHLVSGEVSLEEVKGSKARFYQYVSYKGVLFRKSADVKDGKAEGAFSAVRFVPVGEDAAKFVQARLVHNETHDSTPYFLRAGNKFIVGDIPFSYMHEGDRYFAFADLLFDILGEEPRRTKPLGFARIEDIHGYADLRLLRAAFATLRAEDVPISIAHIPLFMDPFNTVGAGKIERPSAANLVPGFADLISEVKKHDRNAVLWHGTTHQSGLKKNPHSGASGDDYEFWDMVADRPVARDGVPFTLERLSEGLRVFEHYKIAPRYWVTPHYHASAANNRVFGAAFPWVVGRVTYYASSLKPTFTLKGSEPLAVPPSVNRESLEKLKAGEWPDLDRRSKGAFTQMFPYEIYRDIYGQRIIPETLGYLSFSTSEQTSFVRLPEHMLQDAQRNKVVRDYWASFFFHPYLFAARDDGGVGRHFGDTVELRKLLIGLKLLGYEFIGLPEFEGKLAPQLKKQELSKAEQ